MKLPRGVRPVLGALIALGVALGLSVGVVSTAQAYPDITFKAEVSAKVVVAGQKLETESSASVDCAWSQEWNGTTHRGIGQRMSSSFVAPRVKSRTVIDAHFTCTYLSAGGSTGARSNVGATSWTRTIAVVVVPAFGSTLPPSDRGAGGTAGAGGSGHGHASGRGHAAGSGGQATGVGSRAVAAPLAGPAAQADGTMPNTGGPSVLFLAAGLLLLLSGAVAVRVARGRAGGSRQMPRA